MIYTSRKDCLQIFRRQSPVTVLGPYKRAVIWVQGCEFACAGCIVPESWDEAGGETIVLEELAEWILAQPDIEGITLSGGEPMRQAAALVSLIDTVRRSKDLGVMCYTGYRWEQLQQQGTEAQKSLLDRIDLLVDGTYIESKHEDLLWRGSSNQRLLLLSDRYEQVLMAELAMGDRSAGMQFAVDLTGAFYFTGVPAKKGFREEFAARMQQHGITI
ncbi:radical SAM protein [Planktothrix sp. FACHB-1355]|uniref:Radical SAM protein n=1 Tax=Aerosakkonema funiforme FACHB-1375 TaxID=2949571 RepID=A0A926ZJT5_9CYAN|nr:MULTISPECIES: 4Fe-4S single cluster domain-containing protein [Oscillatoriales]MBD2185873.1 radical SAM protein [Aerosakkonema funiforme FACHB-1375]MBD3559344.1 radical SAM protein [Planktothrix sp. FACHB-1355]